MKGADFAVDWRRLCRRTSLRSFPQVRLLLPVKLTRPAGKSTVKLTLVTSQITPLLNNQPDAVKAMRQREAGRPAGENGATAKSRFSCRSRLSELVYDVTVQAELLAAGQESAGHRVCPGSPHASAYAVDRKTGWTDRIEVPRDAKKGAPSSSRERSNAVKASRPMSPSRLHGVARWREGRPCHRESGRVSISSSM